MPCCQKSRYRYRKIADKSEVDETLFGSPRTNFSRKINELCSSEEPERTFPWRKHEDDPPIRKYQQIQGSYVREIRVRDPERKEKGRVPCVINLKELRRLRNTANVPTAADVEDTLAGQEEERQQKIKEVSERKRSFKLIDAGKKKCDPEQSDKDLIASNLQKKRLEENEEIRKLNQLIQEAKIREDNLKLMAIKKAVTDEQNEHDKMMRLYNEQHQKDRNEEDRLKRQTQKDEYTAGLLQQINERRESELNELCRKDSESKYTRAQNMATIAENIDEMERKEEQKKNWKESLEEQSRQQLLRRNSQVEHDGVLAMKDLEFNRKWWERRDRIAQQHNDQVMRRMGDSDLLREQFRENQRRKEEFETARLKRQEEQVERERRQQELLLAQWKREQQEIFKDDLEHQMQERDERTALERIRERKDQVMLLDECRNLLEREKRETHQKLQIKQKMKEDLSEQMKERVAQSLNEMDKQRESTEKIIHERVEQEEVEKYKDQKIKELASQGMRAEHLRRIAKKVHT